MPDTPSQQLAAFASRLAFEQIPENVIRRAQWLFLDWYGSALAGCRSRSAEVFKQFARDMGPESGPCQLFGSAHTSSPLFAALVNAAASHAVEQDDLHNASILHPGAVVFPPLFAMAQSLPAVSGKDFLTAAVVGYECGIRVGEFLGESHYRVFHTTATAGTLAAAMASARMLNLSPEQTLHALGSAGTQAGGLWEFLRDGADSKQLHVAKAAADGLLAAYSAHYGLTAAKQILEGAQGMAQGMLGEGDDAKLTDRLGVRWALTETSFKFHASCRHTHPAADALLQICHEHDLDFRDIEHIRVYVYQAAKDVLGAVDVPNTIHQSKFSMGFVLALIARHRSAGIFDFSEQALSDPINADLRQRVNMIGDADIDQQYPEKWGTRVEVKLHCGEVLQAFVNTPKGDPGNMLSREELEAKVINLALHGGVARAEMKAIIDLIWALSEVASFGVTFPSAASRLWSRDEKMK